MAELPEADGKRIAVAGDADVRELAVGGVGSRRDGGHAAVRRIEAVRAAHEIGGRLGRAADSRQLGDHVRGNGQLVERADDGRGHRIVPTPCTEVDIAPS